MSARTDSQLVAATRKGEIAAFEMIVDRYRGLLISVAHARLGSLPDAEDVAQEAFVQAFFHLHELRKPQALLPWLRRTTERLALMRLRGRREEPIALEHFDTLSGNGADGKSTAADAEVRCILAQLPDRMREALILTCLAGYTCAETALILGVREGTVKSRVNRARAKLREALGMKEEEMVKGKPADDFTRRTIERLRREARRLLAQGDVSGAAERAQALLAEQVKLLFGDPREKGVAATYLAAYESGTFRPDEEATALIGLPRKEQRREECEANAAQYGFRLEDLDWQVADVDVMSETLSKPTGHGKDIWGVPVSRLQLTIVDARELCRRLRCSPLTLHEWVERGCPILRCWPFARFDADRVEQWLADNNIRDWPHENAYDLERPIRIIFREVYEGRLGAERAQKIMADLGYFVWEAPIPWFTGGWDNGRA